MNSGTSFVKLMDGVGAGGAAPERWRRVTECSCLILVGLTGVGKTTVLGGLTASLPVHTLLPDRRKITDILMISRIQAEEGLPVEPVTDRGLRFEYTRRYRQRFPGGMAHALSELSLSPDAAAGLVLFDGLRGENEVRHAAAAMPHARFLMLDAPDAVRISRLIGRRDSFDSTAAPAVSVGGQESLEALGVAELAGLLGEQEQERLLHLVRIGEVTGAELASKARIVLDERRNYDPAATRAALEESTRERALIVDTVAMTADEIGARAIAWLGA